MKTEKNDANARESRKARHAQLGGLGAEWVLQLALFCAVITALTHAVTSLGTGTIA